MKKNMMNKNMKKVSNLVRFTLMGFVALGLAACAASSSGGMTAEIPEGEGIELLVINDRTPPAPITVFLVPESGIRDRLGIVQPGGRETFRFAPSAPSQQFSLRAEAVGEGNTSSEAFTLIDVNVLEWRTASRSVRIRR